MRSPLLIGAAAVAVAVLIAVIGAALEFGSAAYLGALVLGILVVSLIDRDRFWAADLRHRPRRHHHAR
jgi:hypothetical protein